MKTRVHTAHRAAEKKALVQTMVSSRRVCTRAALQNGKTSMGATVGGIAMDTCTAFAVQALLVKRDMDSSDYADFAVELSALKLLTVNRPVRVS